MRQIKFRGKRLDNGAWIYGDLIHIDKSDIGIVTDYDHWSGCRINPDTVGQFTGLLDRNGKEIYEGDIIKVDEFAMPCEVIWYEKTASFQLRYHVDGGFNIPKDALGLWVQDYKDVIAVIGNIHDNPELINQPTEV